VWHFERQPLLANLPPGADQPLRNGFVGREKSARNFPDAEPSRDLQTQCNPGIARNRGMAAHEDQPQFIVPKLLFDIRIAGADPSRLVQRGYEFGASLPSNPVPSNRVDGRIVSHAKQPRRSVFRNSLVRPCLQSPQHGFLHGLLGQLEMSRPEEPRQVGQYPPRLMPE
jgi:hypothetical protein